MPAFLSDFSKFYGTGEVNAAGQTLEEFLDDYDSHKYETPSCTTDAAVFSYRGDKCKSVTGIKILLVKRSNHPSIGFWALPGGFADMREDLSETARRELSEETGVENLPMEQFAVYGDYDRDPRTRVITTAYLSLVNEKDVSVKAGDDAADAVWCEVSVECEKVEWNNEWTKNTYFLKIKNEDCGLDTTAVVEEKVREDLIREKKFSVIDPGMIACDHAAIIVQAYNILKERI
ncbi:MAG: NUDIX domain-containing protein [Lachnospiraceae bacterium]